jgi:hypothetical protein
MENENIDDQIKAAQAEALKTGDWTNYNKLTLQKQNAEGVPERVAKIEDGKALFLPDFKRLESALQKKLADPDLGFNERLQLQEKLTNLSLHWQESGIGKLSVVKAIRENVLNDLRALGSMNLDPVTLELHSSDRRAKVAELDAILAEGERKGMI